MIKVYHQQLDQGKVKYLQFNERAKVTEISYQKLIKKVWWEQLKWKEGRVQIM